MHINPVPVYLWVNHPRPGRICESVQVKFMSGGRDQHQHFTVVIFNGFTDDISFSYEGI